MRTAPFLAAALCLALAAALAAGCRGGDGGAAGEPVPIPMPELAAVEPGVRQQITAEKAELDRLLAVPDTPAADLAAAYGELGLVFLTYEMSEPAEAALTNAVRLAPDELRWTYLLGYLHKLKGRLPEAERHLGRAVELSPDYQPAVIRLAQVRLEQGEPKAARKLFERALEIDGEAAAAHEGLGRTADAEGDPAAAAGHYRRALELAPEASSLRYLLGQALRRAGDSEAARRELAAAGDAPVPIRDPLLAPIASLAESAQFYIVQGSESLDDGNLDAAAASFSRAVELDPVNYTARKAYAYVLEKLGDTEGALDQLAAAVDAARLPREEVEAHAIRGSLLATAGRDEEALPHLARAVELAPAQHGTRLKLADALARRGRFAEAIAHYDRLLAADAGAKSPVLTRRAAALVNLGRHDEALADYRRAVVASPDDPSVRLRHAEALEYLGRGGEAAAERRRAAELSAATGDPVELLAGQGRLAAGHGDLAGAAARYREALAASPERSDVRFALASVLAQAGRHDEALAELGRVIEQAPEHGPARRAEIALLVLTGRYGPARVRLNEALSRFTRDRGLALTQARLLSAAPEPRVRDGELALEVARRIRRDRDDVLAKDTMAMALAETGRFAEAAALQREAIAEAERTGEDALARHMRSKLDAYLAGRAWTAPEPNELLALGLPG
ncbi:MAG TPA: tetratricopeptide repeat protein [Thermoanaerobaculia bacterium]